MNLNSINNRDILFKSVRLMKDNGLGIPIGSVGIVLDVYDDVFCEVEFINKDASTLYLGSVKFEDLELINQ